MAAETKAVPQLESVASLLDLTTAELTSLLKKEFQTIRNDAIEAARYPDTERTFFDFAMHCIITMNPAEIGVLKRIMHRDEVRRMYFFPNEIKAVERILFTIENAGYSQLTLNDLELNSLPPLLYKTRNLLSLNIANNRLRSIDNVKDLKDLQVLIADNNQITDIGFLQGHQRLQVLQMNRNAIGSYEVFKTMPALSEVELAGNKINDTLVRPVLEHFSIQKVKLEDNPLNAPSDILNDVEKLRAHFGIVPTHIPTADPQAGPIFQSYAIRDIRLRGNPDKVLLDIQKLTPIFYDLISNSDRNGEHFFGLFGRWGRGKTFFWRYLLEHNLDRDKYFPIEFHAWKYQDTPGIWAYLYNTLKDAYIGEKPKWYQLWGWCKYWWRLIKLNNERGKLVTAMGILLSVVIGIAAYIYNQHARGEDATSKILRIYIPVSIGSLFVYVAKTFTADARKIISALTTNINFNSQLGFQHEIQQELKYLIRAWIPDKQISKKRIFLFIDDIDRCSEDKIIQIVDYIRVLLHCTTIQDRITVLAAIDERILLHAIQQKYKQFIENKDNDATYKELCREYMDKLFLAGLKLGPLTEFEKKQIVEGFTDADTSNIVVYPQYEKNGIDGVAVAEAIKQANEPEKQTAIPEPNGSPSATAIPVTPTNIPSTAQKEFPYEKWEQEFIKEILARNTESTPRSIRVYTYRYLLGKQLVEKALQQGKASCRQWYNTKEAKQCFAIKLLHYGFKSDTDHLMADYKNFIADYNETQTVKENIYGYEIALNQELGSIMFQVLTMIIAY